MTIVYGGNLGLMSGGAKGEEHYDPLMNFMRGLDALVQPRVRSIVSSLPTSGMADGDVYVYTGADANQNKLARYSVVLAGWEYFTPKNGWEVRVLDQLDGNGQYKIFGFKGGAWAEQLSTGGLTIAEGDARYEKLLKHNLTATTDPTSTDDTSQGYSILSKWLNTTTKELYFCVDTTAGAAKWEQATLTIDDLGTAAMSNVGSSANNLPTVSTVQSLISGQPVFVPSDASGPGVKGLVPAPPATEVKRFLANDGTWALITQEDIDPASGENLGNGAAVYLQTVGNVLQFKTLVSTDGSVSITVSEGTLDFSATGSVAFKTLQQAGSGGIALLSAPDTTTLSAKQLKPGNNITLQDQSGVITINATGGSSGGGNVEPVITEYELFYGVSGNSVPNNNAILSVTEAQALGVSATFTDLGNGRFEFKDPVNTPDALIWGVYLKIKLPDYPVQYLMDVESFALSGSSQTNVALNVASSLDKDPSKYGWVAINNNKPFPWKAGDLMNDRDTKFYDMVGPGGDYLGGTPMQSVVFGLYHIPTGNPEPIPLVPYTLPGLDTTATRGNIGSLRIRAKFEIPGPPVNDGFIPTGQLLSSSQYPALALRSNQTFGDLFNFALLEEVPDVGANAGTQAQMIAYASSFSYISNGTTTYYDCVVGYGDPGGDAFADQRQMAWVRVQGDTGPWVAKNLDPAGDRLNSAIVQIEEFQQRLVLVRDSQGRLYSSANALDSITPIDLPDVQSGTEFMVGSLPSGNYAPHSLAGFADGTSKLVWRDMDENGNVLGWQASNATPPEAGQFIGCAFGSGRHLAINNDGKIWVTTDFGQTWAEYAYQLPLNNGNPYFLRAIQGSDNGFVIWADNDIHFVMNYDESAGWKGPFRIRTTVEVNPAAFRLTGSSLIVAAQVFPESPPTYSALFIRQNIFSGTESGPASWKQSYMTFVNNERLYLAEYGGQPVVITDNEMAPYEPTLWRSTSNTDGWLYLPPYEAQEGYEAVVRAY
ncbi:TPA: DUF2793 domain-containing protein [Pseudomonas aeruginosa]|nr:DUF2793 domain-containing protein [Pseudomonas aeruginosa]